MDNIAKVGPFSIRYTNKKEFEGIKEEIFKSHIYNFTISDEFPVIVDCGSHIGISILYFKSIYSKSIIYGYEPNPISYKLLKENTESNNLQDVNLNNSAADVKDGEKSFYIDTTKDLWLSTSGYINGSWKKIFSDEEFKVKTINFLSELNRIIQKHNRVNILKLDIEGYEIKLLPHISEVFPYIENLVMEYHPINKNGFAKVLDILRRNYHNIEFIQKGKIVENPDVKDLVIMRCSNG